MKPFVHHWYLGARPRTLPASVVPVLMGTAAAATHTSITWWYAIAAMGVALSLQIGVNYANDYSDGVRGTDENRAGPMRLVGSGLASAAAVKRAALGMFALAGVIGAVLSLAVDPWLLLVGAAAIPAAWFYTGGPKPYGYVGLGEVFVFVFFGLVATLGSEYVQDRSISVEGCVVAVCAGLLAVALLLVNNLRDIEGDRKSGKRTLVVRLGMTAGRAFYTLALLVPFVLATGLAFYVDRLGVLLVLFALVSCVTPVRTVWRQSGRALLPALGTTGRTQLAFGFLISVGLVL